MTEQLNEREKWIFFAAVESCDAGDRSIDDFEECYGDVLPPDPNLARITELEAEVARLNGLLNEVGDADYHLSSNTFFRDEVRSILSRRTAERKEPTDASD